MSSIAGIGGGFMPQAVSGASGRMPQAAMMADLFQKIDVAGSGTISKSQFDTAFQTLNPPAGFKSMGADAIFKMLDPNGAGSVSQQDFVSGMKNVIGQIRARAAGGDNDSRTSPATTLGSSLQSLQATLGNDPFAANSPSGSIIKTSA